METKDKKYVENLLRNYKKNKSRLRILELGKVSDLDNTLGGMDYSNVRVQTSNISSLDSIIENRENEKYKLINDIGVAEALIDSLYEKDRFIIWQYYIEHKTLLDIAYEMNYKETRTVWANKERIINNMLELV